VVKNCNWLYPTTPLLVNMRRKTKYKGKELAFIDVWLMEYGRWRYRESVTSTSKKFKLHFYSCFMAKAKLELLILLAPLKVSRLYRELVYLLLYQL
jgi:hypothetical protein